MSDQGLDRRSFLAGAAGAVTAAAQAQDAQARPNILHIMTDQQQWATIAGRSGCRTPNIDRLAQQGMLFERSYTPSAVCCPARAMLLERRLSLAQRRLQPGAFAALRASRHEPRRGALLAAPARGGLSPGLRRKVARELPAHAARFRLSRGSRASAAATRHCSRRWNLNPDRVPRATERLKVTNQRDDALAGVGTVRHVGLSGRSRRGHAGVAQCGTGRRA